MSTFSEEFQGKYRKRSGIESTEQLGETGDRPWPAFVCRGKKSVFMSIYLKVAGWNVLRLLATATIRDPKNSRNPVKLRHLRTVQRHS